MKVLYITFTDLSRSDSGSTVRPNKMLSAFKDIGLEVKLLSAKEKPKKQRKNAVSEINKWLNDNKPDFCYIESSTGPIRNRCDLKLIKRLHKMGVKMGFFMRDFYYYEIGKPYLMEEFLHKPNRLKELIRIIYLKILTHRDRWFLYKYIDIMYFATETAASYLKFKKTNTLPPAGDNYLIQNRTFSRTCIYVGGISKAYGFDLLIKAFDYLNKNECNITYNLILVCREKEYERYKNDLEYSWLEVHHVSGDKLKPLYERASVGLISKVKNRYNDMTLSIKLFEYMSYGLPVVVTDNYEMSKIVKQERIGIVTEYDVIKFADGIKQILKNKDIYATYERNVKKALLSNNLWIHRAKKVANDLTE